jgi:hypothetical protein
MSVGWIWASPRVCSRYCHRKAPRTSTCVDDTWPRDDLTDGVHRLYTAPREAMTERDAAGESADRCRGKRHLPSQGQTTLGGEFQVEKAHQGEESERRAGAVNCDTSQCGGPECNQPDSTTNKKQHVLSPMFLVVSSHQSEWWPPPFWGV